MKKEAEAARARTREDGPGTEPPPDGAERAPSADATDGADSDELYDRVLHAAGHVRGNLPTWWLPPAAILHVTRWRHLGLTDDEIVEVVHQTQAQFDERSTGPKAFDFAMRRFAAEKAAPLPERPPPRFEQLQPSPRPRVRARTPDEIEEEKRRAAH